MSPDSYIASIGTTLAPFAPTGWLPCNGQTLQINAYQPLYSLIGNRYGGSPTDGTFMLPAFNPDGQPDKDGRLVVICVNGIYPARP